MVNAAAVEEVLWTKKDVIAFFSGMVSLSWVERHTKSGELPSLKIFGKRFYEPAVVIAWAKSKGRRN